VGEATERLSTDPRLSAVTLTGSERAGAAVGAAADRTIGGLIFDAEVLFDPAPLAANATPVSVNAAASDVANAILRSMRILLSVRLQRAARDFSHDVLRRPHRRRASPVRVVDPAR